MRLEDFDFELPRELIALYPSEVRSRCRLLCLDGDRGELSDRIFSDLPDLLEEGDLLVFNDTRVLRARLLGHKESGGAVEILIERPLGARTALCHMRASKAAKAGTKIILEGGAQVVVTGREGEFFTIATEDQDLLPLLDACGHIPLPPYIDRADEPLDADRYQTVYSRIPGAVAAPTAGLHFDEELLAILRRRGVKTCCLTLHVGSGTFQPVRESDITHHHMHKEYVHLSEEVVQEVLATRAAGHRVIAVGTTCVRSLESAAMRAREIGSERLLEPFSGETEIFIYPGVPYQVVDALITNFHLPQSTLIMLVAAFAGYRRTLEAYAHAVAQRYHFFSYGDAMFITKNHQAAADLPPQGD